jgi:hypothetical protein
LAAAAAAAHPRRLLLRSRLRRSRLQAGGRGRTHPQQNWDGGGGREDFRTSAQTEERGRISARTPTRRISARGFPHPHVGRPHIDSFWFDRSLQFEGMDRRHEAWRRGDLLELVGRDLEIQAGRRQLVSSPAAAANKGRVSYLKPPRRRRLRAKHTREEEDSRTPAPRQQKHSRSRRAAIVVPPSRFAAAARDRGTPFF